MSDDVFADAQRYLVWQDPEVKPLELIAEMLENLDIAIDGACRDLREQLEGEHHDEQEDLHEELVGVLQLIDREAEYKYEHTTIADLVRHLEREVSTVKLRIAADAEREQADKFAELQHQYEQAVFEIERQKSEIVRLKEGASPKPKPKRKRRGVSPREAG